MFPQVLEPQCSLKSTINQTYHNPVSPLLQLLTSVAGPLRTICNARFSASHITCIIIISQAKITWIIPKHSLTPLYNGYSNYRTPTLDTRQSRPRVNEREFTTKQSVCCETNIATSSSLQLSAAEFDSFITGYNVYEVIWTPVVGELCF